MTYWNSQFVQTVVHLKQNLSCYHMYYADRLTQTACTTYIVNHLFWCMTREEYWLLSGVYTCVHFSLSGAQQLPFQWHSLSLLTSFDALFFLLHNGCCGVLCRDDSAAACKTARNVGALCFNSYVTAFQLKDLSSSSDLMCIIEGFVFNWQRCLHSNFTVETTFFNASNFADGTARQVRAVYAGCLYRSAFAILLYSDSRRVKLLMILPRRTRVTCILLFIHTHADSGHLITIHNSLQ